MYLSSKNFKAGGLDLSKVDFISEKDFERHFREKSKAVTKPRTGDVLVGIIGSLGEPYVVQPRDHFGLSSSVAILRPDRGVILPEYLYYWMRGDRFQGAVYGTKGGVAQSYLSLEMIRSLPLEFPPLAYQERIVSILSAYDDLIENNTRRIKILEEMAQMLYREWFVHFRFPGHEKVRMVESKLGPIPEGWTASKLGEVLSLEYGKALKAEERLGGPVPVYGSSGVVGFHSQKLTDGPGLIVGRKGNVGSVFFCESTFWVIDTAYYVRSELSTYFLYFNLLTQNFLNNDAAVPGLNRNQAYSLPLALPDEATLKAFDQISKPMFDLKRSLELRNANLRTTRDLLLPRLISGEIAVEAADNSAAEPQEEVALHA